MLNIFLSLITYLICKRNFNNLHYILRKQINLQFKLTLINCIHKRIKFFNQQIV